MLDPTINYTCTKFQCILKKHDTVMATMTTILKIRIDLLGTIHMTSLVEKSM